MALKLSVAAPEDDPSEWVFMAVAGRLEPSEGVLADSWSSVDPHREVYTPRGSTEHGFSAGFAERGDSIQVSSGLLALGHPLDVPFVVGHLELGLVSKAGEEWWDSEVDGEAGGFDSPGMMREVRIPIVVGTWSMPDVQFRFPHYQPTVDLGWPMRSGHDYSYSLDPTEVIWTQGGYVADW